MSRPSSVIGRPRRLDRTLPAVFQAVHLTLAAMVLFVLFPVLIPLGVTLTPLLVTGVRRVRTGLGNGRRQPGRVVVGRRSPAVSVAVG